MSDDPLAVKTVPADEQWDETLDTLAKAVTREMDERCLLREDADDAVRYHVRSFGRRLVNPLLDQVRTEVQAGYRQALRLKEENLQLKGRLAEMERMRRRGRWRVALWCSLLAVLALTLAGLLYHTELQPHDVLGKDVPAAAAPVGDGWQAPAPDGLGAER
jgi:hypothetical protein